MVVAVKQKPKETPHHRKRQGAHQRRNNRFVKTYWPYLPLLVIVGAGLFLNSLWTQTSGVLSYATEMTQGGLLSRTNDQRMQNGYSDLALSSTLSKAAQAKAEDMVARNYWAHTTPDGKEPWIFINQTGYLYQAAGENLAYGFATSGDAVTGWMNSPGHRANILNNSYTEVGFGVANAPDYQGNGEQTIVVAMYAKPLTATSSGSAPAAQDQPVQAASGQPIATNKSKSQDIAVRAVVPGQTKVARVQMATSGSAPWSVYAISAVAVLLLFLFILRHSFAWHRVLVRGEDFILRHKMLDVIIVGGIMVGFLLTRTVGVIQ